jgi:hypothetical protein
MNAARLPPREEDEGSAAFSHTYRITVQEPDGSTHEHQFTTLGQQQLELGDVVQAGQAGWAGPTVSIEEIDRHPDALHSGMALAWPMSLGVQHGSRTVSGKP